MVAARTAAGVGKRGRTYGTEQQRHGCHNCRDPAGHGLRLQWFDALPGLQCAPQGDPGLSDLGYRVPDPVAAVGQPRSRAGNPRVTELAGRVKVGGPTESDMPHDPLSGDCCWGGCCGPGDVRGQRRL
jgi:hypothetical protein